MRRSSVFILVAAFSIPLCLLVLVAWWIRPVTIPASPEASFSSTPETAATSDGIVEAAAPDPPTESDTFRSLDTAVVTGRVRVRNDDFWNRLTGQYREYDGEENPYKASGPLMPDTGFPADGVPVRLEGNGITREVETTEEGHYEFTDLADGNYDLSVPLNPTEPDGTRMHRAASIVRGRGAELEDIVLDSSSIDVYGLVVDLSDVPVAGAQIVVSSTLEDPKPDQAVEITVISDDLGRFEFPSLQPVCIAEELNWSPEQTNQVGVYTLRVSADGFVGTDIKLPVASESESDAIKALGEARERSQRNQSGRRLTVDTNLPFPPAGHAIHDVKIVVARAASVSGQLVGTNGEPQTNRLLHFIGRKGRYKAPSDFREQRKDHYAATTDERGQFVISGVPPGTYKFHIPNGEIALQGKPDRLQVKDGEQLTAVRVTVQTPDSLGAVEGNVRIKGKTESVAGVDVQIDSVETQSAFELRAEPRLQTDPQGRYRFENLPEGRVHLSFGIGDVENQDLYGTPGYAFLGEATVRPGQTTRLDVNLEPEARIVLHVTENGLPVEKFDVRFTWLGPGVLRHVRTLRDPERADTSIIALLPQGECRLTVTGPTRRMVHFLASTRAGQITDVNVEVGGTAAIRFRQSESSELEGIFGFYLIDLPIDDPRLQPEKQAVAPSEFIVSGDMQEVRPGRFYDFPLVPAGSYTVGYMTIVPSIQWHLQSVTVADGETLELTID